VTSSGIVTLHGGDARIEVVPAQGGWVRSLQMGGREWLVQGETSSAPRPGSGVLAGAGWSECVPTFDARSPLSSLELRTSAEGHRLTCVWGGDGQAWTLSRTLLVRPDGAVEARYDASATGTERVPFVWNACLLVPFDARTRLRMPETTRFRVESVTGTEAGALATGTHQWPRLTIDGRARDLSEPWQLPKACMVTGWLDLAGARSAMQVAQGDTLLTVAMDGEGVPHCGVVLDRAGVRAGAKRGAFSRTLPPAVALLPSLGVPPQVVDALGDTRTIAGLTPGTPRRWSMTLRAGKAS
jgi:hypothetical protein